jgi:hypothetical protein
VAEWTLKLGEAMGMEGPDLINDRRGALLHDIGKIGVPESILLKPGPLSDEEWEVMRKHPRYAHLLLSEIPYLRAAVNIPYCHHEKWDGSGYPRGLKGKEIPLAARVFSVVEVWDVLGSDRPYREAWPNMKIREHLKSQSGIDFDPEIVEKFLDLEREGGFTREPASESILTQDEAPQEKGTEEETDAEPPKETATTEPQGEVTEEPQEEVIEEPKEEEPKGTVLGKLKGKVAETLKEKVSEESEEKEPQETLSPEKPETVDLKPEETDPKLEETPSPEQPEEVDLKPEEKVSTEEPKESGLKFKDTLSPEESQEPDLEPKETLSPEQPSEIGLKFKETVTPVEPGKTDLEPKQTGLKSEEKASPEEPSETGLKLEDQDSPVEVRGTNSEPPLIFNQPLMEAVTQELEETTGDAKVTERLMGRVTQEQLEPEEEGKDT